MDIAVQEGILACFQDDLAAPQIAYGTLDIAGKPEMSAPTAKLRREIADIIRIDLRINETAFHTDAGLEIGHVVQRPEPHREEIAQMAFVGLQIEACKFHGFGIPADMGAEPFHVQPAAL